jgi:tetratricopeptide (TPR) repeat protein
MVGMAQALPAEEKGSKPDRVWDVWAGVVVACAAAVVYLPSLGGAFIWNDSDYVTAPRLRSLHGLLRIWTRVGATQQYYPLLHSFFWIQHRLWGDQPAGYHIATVLLHAGAAILFGAVLRRLAVPGAWLAALLFALHPVHVESVAWITEQKNTLSTVFYLAAALAYLGFDKTRKRGAYSFAAALFILSLLCKTVTVTLPFALLVVLWWKRGELRWRRDIRPLVPWFVLGAAAGIFSSWVERRFLGAQGADFTLSFAGRILVAGRAVWFYLGQILWPSDLNFLYLRWTVDTSHWWQWLFPLTAAALLVFLWKLRRRSRSPLAVALFFIGSLFPVLGFVNLYGAFYSWVWDHWQYLPDLGPLALAGAGLSWACERAWGRWSVSALVVVLGGLTWEHCAMFRDNETLYRSTLVRNPAAWMAHTNLGILMASRPGGLPEAISEFETSLKYNPDNPNTHNSLGSALSGIPGRLDDAMSEYREALRLLPDFPEAHINLGNALMASPGHLSEAVFQYQEALRLDRNSAGAHASLGFAYLEIPGRLADAIAEYREALRINPDFPEAHNAIGTALSRNPETLAEAIAEYREAIRLNPDFAEAHNNLGNALARRPGGFREAISEFDTALRIRPDYVQARYNLGVTLLAVPGRRDDALAQFKEVLRLRPGFAPAKRRVEELQSAQP